MPLAALQLSFNRLSEEVGAFLAVLKNGVHPVKRPLGEPSRDLLMIDLFSTHAEIYPISPKLTSPPQCDIIYKSDGRAT